MAAQQGHKRVYLYLGGLTAWADHGNKIECRQKVPENPVPVLSPGAVKKLVVDQPGLVVLDIRDADLWDKMRIDVPVLIHIRAVDILDKLDSLPRDKPIVLIDHIATQVIIVSRFLESNGFKILGYVDGGTMNWARAGLPVRLGKTMPSPSGG